jgi:hypothetical protein
MMRRSSRNGKNYFTESSFQASGTKLTIKPKPGMGISPKRSYSGGRGRLGEVSPPELDEAERTPIVIGNWFESGNLGAARSRGAASRLQLSV